MDINNDNTIFQLCYHIPVSLGVEGGFSASCEDGRVGGCDGWEGGGVRV